MRNTTLNAAWFDGSLKSGKFSLIGKEFWLLINLIFSNYLWWPVTIVGHIIIETKSKEHVNWDMNYTDISSCTYGH